MAGFLGTLNPCKVVTVMVLAAITHSVAVSALLTMHLQCGSLVESHDPATVRLLKRCNKKCSKFKLMLIIKLIPEMGLSSWCLYNLPHILLVQHWKPIWYKYLHMACAQNALAAVYHDTVWLRTNKISVMTALA